MSTPTTTFTWAVGTMDRQLSNGAVQTVHYTVTANDGTYEAGAYGSVTLTILKMTQIDCLFRPD